MSRVFIDTNLLLYGYGSQDLRKQATAVALISALVPEGNAWVSLQVLREFAVAARNKLNRSEEEIQRDLDELARLPRIAEDLSLIRRAVSLQFRYGIHFYDSLILAAAEAADCEQLLTEDLNHGQRYGTVLVQNPFLESPA